MPKTTKVPQRVYLCLACQDIPEPGQRVRSKFVQQIWWGFKSVLLFHTETVKPAARRLRNWKWNSFLGWYTWCVALIMTHGPRRVGVGERSLT